jgi:hypothetical protein
MNEYENPLKKEIRIKLKVGNQNVIQMSCYFLFPNS